MSDPIAWYPLPPLPPLPAPPASDAPAEEQAWYRQVVYYYRENLRLDTLRRQAEAELRVAQAAERHADIMAENAPAAIPSGLSLTVLPD